MQRTRLWLCIGILLLGSAAPTWAQQPVAVSNGVNPSAVVPPLVSFSGEVTDVNGKPLSSVVGVTFALYKEAQGDAPLWLETQSVYPDKSGHYTVLLGSTKSTGLPSNLFTAGEVRWLSVQVHGQAEQPRVLLSSVPYALKAADAQTVGGLPASAFVLAAPGGAVGSSAVSASSGTAAITPNLAGTGTQNYVPLWTDSAGTLGNSVLYQTGSGSTAKIGINTITPSSTLDVKGGSTVRGTFTLPATGTATASAGKKSQPQVFVGSAFNSGTGTAVNQKFQWQVEPVGNNTASTSGTLNLLYATGTNAPAETGLNIASNGQITFAPGQTFPGTGPGTVTRVGSGAGLTGGPITGSGALSIATGGVTNAMLVNPSLTITPGTDLTGGGAVALGGTTTLSLDTSKVPQLGTANSFAGSQTINGNVIITATGTTLSASGGSTGVSGSGSSYGVNGNSTATQGLSIGVYGQTASSYGYGVYGNNTGISGSATGVYGTSNAPFGYGVSGNNTAISGSATGVYGQTASSSGYGVEGVNSSGTGLYGAGALYGVYGNNTNSQGLAGVYGAAASGSGYGVWGSNNSKGPGVFGNSTSGSGVQGVSGSYAGVYGTGPTYGVLGNSTSGTGVSGSSASSSGYGVSGNNTASGGGTGVYGSSYAGYGVKGSGTLAGVYGSGGSYGVFGDTSGSSSGGPGVYGTTANNNSYGVAGYNTSTSGIGVYGSGASRGVYGYSASSSGYGVYGISNSNIGVYGKNVSGGSGVYGDGGFNGIYGNAAGTNGYGVYGVADQSGGVGVYGRGGAYSAYFPGTVYIGTLQKNSGSFKIDHPLDPANKYLYHSFVESPDMMNIYNGNVVTDKHGLATIELPDWFEALNRDFRYQLTVIGQFAQAIVVKEVSNHQFTIKTSKPGVKVSWQVTGIRQDAYANAHRIPVEETKPPQEQGRYLHPELFGAGPEKSVSVGATEPSPVSPAQAALASLGERAHQH